MEIFLCAKAVRGILVGRTLGNAMLLFPLETLFLLAICRCSSLEVLSLLQSPSGLLISSSNTMATEKKEKLEGELSASDCHVVN